MGLGGTSARITWEDNGTQTHELIMPFQGIIPARNPTKVRWSRDGSTPSVVRVDSGRSEATVRVRYEPYSSTWWAMMVALVERKIAGNYYRDVTNFPAEFDTFIVVSPESLEGVDHAPDYPHILEFDMTWRIRRPTTGDWDYLFA